MNGGDMMAKSKGAMSKRNIDKILRKNGYQIIRCNGHWIYSNGTNTIAIPKSLCTPLIQRLFKENNIKEDL